MYSFLCLLLLLLVVLNTFPLVAACMIYRIEMLFFNELPMNFVVLFAAQIYSPRLDSAPPRWVNFAHGLLLFLYQVCLNHIETFFFLKSFYVFAMCLFYVYAILRTLGFYHFFYCLLVWHLTIMLDLWCCWWEASQTNKFLKSIGGTFWPW